MQSYALRYLLSSFLGPPSEKHCYADIEAAYDFLRNTLEVPATNIVLYGRSLGSGPSCHLAAGRSQLKEPVGGVILHAPFLSVFRIVLDSGCTLIGDKFPNIDLVPMIESPILFVHGTADQIVPFYHSQQLHSAVQKNYKVEPLFIDGMTHNNVHVAVRQKFITRLMDFLEKNIVPHASLEKSENTLKVKLKYFDRKIEDEFEGLPSTLQLQQ
jgi:abhydrolase domain-containing protein 17